MYPFCATCGRGVPAGEQQFNRCGVCVDRLLDTVTEATPFHGMIETVRHQIAARQTERRGR